MVRRLICAAMFAVALLSGCASQEAQTPAQRVYALQADYNAVLAVAVTYESQKRCTTTVIAACSSVTVVNELRRGDDAARAALKAAQDTVRTPGATSSTINTVLVGAANAIQAFRTIAKTYNLPGAT